MKNISLFFSQLHTLAFDRAATMPLLKELLWLIAGRGDNDNGGEGKVGDKVNLVIEGGESCCGFAQRNIFSINKYFRFFLVLIFL
jgi:hypothetical protein